MMKRKLNNEEDNYTQTKDSNWMKEIDFFIIIIIIII